MSFVKSRLILGIPSLIFGGLMFFLVLRLIPLKQGDGYAVLAVDASYPDRFIGELLSPQGADKPQGYSPAYISESTQWVFLDDFGVLERIPLVEYRDRVEMADPRDDGYPEKLRSFFVREGKRLFFIPFTGESLGTRFKSRGGSFEAMNFSDPWVNKRGIQGIEASITASLQDPVQGAIPFAIQFFGYERPLIFYFLLFILAGMAALGFSAKPRFLPALLPVLAPLVCLGPPGFFLCTLLVAIFGVLAEPIRELLACYRYRRFSDACSGQGNFMKGPGFLKSLSPGWLVSLGRVTLWLGLLWLWAIPGMYYTPSGGSLDISRGNMMILGAAGMVSLLGILGLILWIESSRGKTQDHIRFTQVRIMAPANRVLINPFTPFALVSLLSLYMPQMIEGFYTYHNPKFIADPRYLIEADAYEKHAAFQASFSFIPLGSKEGFSWDGGNSRYAPKSYGYGGQYSLGEDGLIGNPGNPPLNQGHYEAPDYQEIPPFPLENLIAFLKDLEQTYAADTRRITPINRVVLVPMLLVPGVYLIVLFGLKQNAGKKRNILIYHDKRIAA